MKVNINIIIAATAAALAAAGCKPSEVPSEGSAFTVSVVSQDRPWSSGSKLYLLESAENPGFPPVISPYVSVKTSVSADTPFSASFGFDAMPAIECESYSYCGYYPYSALDSEPIDLTEVVLNLPDAQSAGNAQPDAAALLGRLESVAVSGKRPSKIETSLSALTSLLHIRFDNIPADENVSRVVFSVVHDTRNVALAGKARWSFSGSKAEFTMLERVFDIVFTPDSPDTHLEEVVFSTLPFDLVEGDSYSYRIETPSRIVSESVVLEDGQTFEAKAGSSACIEIDMTGEGDYESGVHPRLIFTPSVLEADKKIVASLSAGSPKALLHEWCLGHADKISYSTANFRYSTDPSVMLTAMQEVLDRLLFTSYAYIFTKEDRYLDSAIEHIEMVMSYKDWSVVNSALILGDLNAGMALAYDWLYPYLDEDLRTEMRENIFRNGIQPHLNAYDEFGHYTGGFVSGGYLGFVNNWNQICCGGLTLACLAIMDDLDIERRALCKRVLKQVRGANERIATRIYGSTGAYPEGQVYWNYGGTFQCLMCQCLEDFYGEDTHSAKLGKFLDSYTYGIYTEDLSVRCTYCYSDSGHWLMPYVALWYYAWKLGNPSLAYSEVYKVLNGIEFKTSNYGYNATGRALPAFMRYVFDLDLGNLQGPEGHIYDATADATPILIVRDGWSGNDSRYLAMKAGDAVSVTHSHMDIGSFVYDQGGVRWSEDYGSTAYAPMEAVSEAVTGSKIGFSTVSSGAFRWTINVLNCRHHSTLCVKDYLHYPNGRARFTEVVDTPSEMGGVIDMTESLGNAGIKKAVRRIMLTPEGLQITDSLSASSSRTVEFRMLTRASVSVTDDGVVLSSGGKRMLLSAEATHGTVKYCNFGYNHEPWQSTANYWDIDLASEGYKVVGFTIDVSSLVAVTTKLKEI
ncbi:MAG: heparinase II/III family protein [Bacteroidales bacterium]|nr:heparinase II/III family protein [Candidatus Cryptobacteroides aphodequi]